MKIFLFLSAFYILPCFADTCLQYKTNPTINIKNPIANINVVQPDTPIDYAHGNVVATLVNDFEIVAEPMGQDSGACIMLKSIDATIGYSDFEISIDRRHTPNSCTYNAILKHENEHIKTYLSVIKDNEQQILAAVQIATDSIVPIFISNSAGQENALDAFHHGIEQHPEIILLRQKIMAEQEIRNKKIDQNRTADTLSECE